jgi:hypothetical protein
MVKRDDRLWVAKALFNNSLSVGNCFVYSVFRGVGKSFCDIPQSVGKKALRPAGQPRKPGAKKFPHLFISLHLILSLPVYWALRVQRISDLAAGQPPSPADMLRGQADMLLLVSSSFVGNFVSNSHAMLRRSNRHDGKLL